LPAASLYWRRHKDDNNTSTIMAKLPFKNVLNVHSTAGLKACGELKGRLSISIRFVLLTSGHTCEIPTRTVAAVPRR